MAKKIVMGSLRKHPFLLAARWGRHLRAKRPQWRRARRNVCFRRLCQGRRWAGSYQRSVACRIISSVAGQYQDPIKAINSVVYPFPIAKINLNIFNKHKSVCVNVGVLWIDCDYRRIFDK